MAKLKCEHLIVSRGRTVDLAAPRLSIHRSDPVLRIVVDQRFCIECGTAFPLGPSNDEPASVQVEILAAEVGQSPDVWRRYMDLDADIEADLVRLVGVGNPLGLGALSPDAQHVHMSPLPAAWTASDIACYWSGWLALEMSSHDGHEARDAAAWPWDVTRPIAEQEGEIARTIDLTANVLEGIGDEFGNVYEDDHAPPSVDPVLQAAAMTVGQRLRLAREQAMLTQQDVQKRLGCALAFVYQSEDGKYEPDDVDLGAFAGIYGVTVEWLRGDAIGPVTITLGEPQDLDDLLAEQTRHDVAASVVRHGALVADALSLTPEEHAAWQAEQTAAREGES